MEVDILGAMASAAAGLVQPQMLFFLFIGVAIGSVIAVIPGVGGLMGLSLLLPFTFAMQPMEAVAFLLGALAVMSTADSIPAILFGVPGTPTSMVTVLDGYPMAKKGAAGRAMGAAFSSSVVGGIVGALILLIIIPVSMPLLMGATSPELLAFCILGLAMVGALAGGSMAKGIGAALIGVMIGFIGQDPNTATLRWTFGTIYLWDGVNILIVALGLYALPELADLAISEKSIASDGKKQKLTGVSEGIRDAGRNLWPITRSGAVSSVLGIIPAIGPTVIPWLVYTYTKMVTRGKSEFGQGDVRGVIASESSNNATVGGALLPTVVLGVPGSAPMALLLGAFLLHGIAPGPSMLTTNLDMTYMMVWGIVLANVLGGLFALGMARPLSSIVYVRPSILIPLISVIVFAGALQATRSWEDGLFVLAVGALGWLMKRAEWPRAPLFLAFILAPLIERYFFISMNVHGWNWVSRPFVSILLITTVLFILGVTVSRAIAARRKAKDRVGYRFAPVLNTESAFAIAVALVSALALWTALGWRYEAGIMPQTASAISLAMALLALAGQWVVPRLREGARVEKVQHFDLEADFGDLTTRQILGRGALYIGMLVGLGSLSWLIGILPAIPVFVIAYMLIHREKPLAVLLITAGYSIVIYLLFVYLLRLAWPVAQFDLMRML